MQIRRIKHAGPIAKAFSLVVRRVAPPILYNLIPPHNFQLVLDKAIKEGITDPIFYFHSKKRVFTMRETSVAVYASFFEEESEVNPCFGFKIRLYSAQDVATFITICEKAGLGTMDHYQRREYAKYFPTPNGIDYLWATCRDGHLWLYPYHGEAFERNANIHYTITLKQLRRKYGNK